MARVKDPSWLLSDMPEMKNPTGEHRLWWGVIRQAAGDLRYGNRSIALDGLEYLRDSGVYLLSWLFGVEEVETRREIAGLVMRRNAFHQQPLDGNAVRPHSRARIRR